MTVTTFVAVMTSDMESTLAHAPKILGLTAVYLAVNVEPENRAAVGEFYTRFASVCWPIGI